MKQFDPAAHVKAMSEPVSPRFRLNPMKFGNNIDFAEDAVMLALGNVNDLID